MSSNSDVLASIDQSFPPTLHPGFPFENYLSDHLAQLTSVGALRILQFNVLDQVSNGYPNGVAKQEGRVIDDYRQNQQDKHARFTRITDFLRIVIKDHDRNVISLQEVPLDMVQHFQAFFASMDGDWIMSQKNGLVSFYKNDEALGHLNEGLSAKIIEQALLSVDNKAIYQGINPNCMDGHTVYDAQAKKHILHINAHVPYSNDSIELERALAAIARSAKAKFDIDDVVVCGDFNRGIFTFDEQPRDAATNLTPSAFRSVNQQLRLQGFQEYGSPDATFHLHNGDVTLCHAQTPDPRNPQKMLSRAPSATKPLGKDNVRQRYAMYSHLHQIGGIPIADWQDCFRGLCDDPNLTIAVYKSTRQSRSHRITITTPDLPSIAGVPTIEPQDGVYTFMLAEQQTKPGYIELANGECLQFQALTNHCFVQKATPESLQQFEETKQFLSGNEKIADAITENTLPSALRIIMLAQHGLHTAEFVRNYQVALNSKQALPYLRELDNHFSPEEIIKISRNIAAAEPSLSELIQHLREEGYVDFAKSILNALVDDLNPADTHQLKRLGVAIKKHTKLLRILQTHRPIREGDNLIAMLKMIYKTHDTSYYFEQALDIIGDSDSADQLRSELVLELLKVLEGTSQDDEPALENLEKHEWIRSEKEIDEGQKPIYYKICRIQKLVTIATNDCNIDMNSIDYSKVHDLAKKTNTCKMIQFLTNTREKLPTITAIIQTFLQQHLCSDEINIDAMDDITDQERKELYDLSFMNEHQHLGPEDSPLYQWLRSLTTLQEVQQAAKYIHLLKNIFSRICENQRAVNIFKRMVASIDNIVKCQLLFRNSLNAFVLSQGDAQAFMALPMLKQELLREQCVDFQKYLEAVQDKFNLPRWTRLVQLPEDFSWDQPGEPRNLNGLQDTALLTRAIYRRVTANDRSWVIIKQAPLCHLVLQHCERELDRIATSRLKRSAQQKILAVMEYLQNGNADRAVKALFKHRTRGIHRHRIARSGRAFLQSVNNGKAPYRVLKAVLEAIVEKLSGSNRVDLDYTFPVEPSTKNYAKTEMIINAFKQIKRQYDRDDLAVDIKEFFGDETDASSIAYALAQHRITKNSTKPTASTKFVQSLFPVLRAANNRSAPLLEEEKFEGGASLHN